MLTTYQGTITVHPSGIQPDILKWQFYREQIMWPLLLKNNLFLYLLNLYHIKVIPYRCQGIMYFTYCCLVAQSCTTLCNLMDCSPPGSFVHGDSPGKNTGVDCHARLQEIFPIQGSKPGLPHCRRIIYHLSHQGSPINGDKIPYTAALVEMEEKWQKKEGN